ncbi:AHH domain-containing protein [Agarilytica rhodophyticola]|uniref:AHH domain-containing protein n=1 Tax=Agarilytica rhodophyticola TaxID=1737490 RepID=UPI001319EB16|nr:AHH domain-containing protein [Agarilytica rhodophyticola]
MFPDIKFPQAKVDWLIADFVKKDKPSIADFMRLKTIGGLYDRLDRYRAEAINMSRKDLIGEHHRSSRLARNMTAAGDPRPSSRCDCHALISGAHEGSVILRAIMAWLLMRIDDPFNGCWLPKDWDDRKYMPNYLRHAVPHCRIHHTEYYNWLNRRINYLTIKTPEQLINALRIVRVLLQSGNVPPNVMPKTGR